MIKFISIDNSNITPQNYISENMSRFAQPGEKINGQTSETGGTDKDAIIFFKKQKTIWAKGTFYTCTPAIEQVISGYTINNISGAVDSTDTILQAIQKLQVQVNAKPNANTTYTFAGGTNKFTVTPSDGQAQEVAVTPSIENNVTKTGNITDDHIILGYSDGVVKDSNKTITTTLGSDNTTIPTSKAVKDAIDALPEPMVFKGSLGTGGTITTLPSASSSNEGFTYKVIKDGTYASIAAKVGDTFISAKTGDNAYSWVLIPSGDEPSGTVTSVDLSVPTGLTVSGGPITSSGTLTVAFAQGYSIPTTTQQNAWSNKQNAITDGSATIASVSNDIVTIKAGVSQSSGAIGNSSGSDILLAKVAKSGNYSDLSNKPTIPTVYDAKFAVKVGNTEIASTTANASQPSDLTIAGDGSITVTGNTTNKTITISLDWEELN